MNQTSNALLDFISKTPTGFHAVKNISESLVSKGYTELNEASDWKLEYGGKYFTTRNLSSLIAFRIPIEKPKSFMITAAHGDSPAFKIKEHAESEAAGFYTRINTEKYGGMIYSSWLDRPLSAAGKITVLGNGTITSKIVDLKRDLFLIPSVAIHMNRHANENASYNPAIDMQPISGSISAKGGYKKLLAEVCGCSEEDILASDMFLYSRDAGKIWGINEEFISSPRLDDLQCVFASYSGFISAKESSACPVLCIYDNEEVGSTTKQGAASTFLKDTLTRITDALGGNHSDYLKSLASSFMVSADNAHAVHPNHPEYSDPSHRPIINGGIVIKHNANQRYTTDALSSAVFTEICRKAGVPVQRFTNRSDIAGGSTLGNISNTQAAVNTVDIGLPQLSMHSSYETAGALDTDYLITALTFFFGSEIISEASDSIRIQ